MGKGPSSESEESRYIPQRRHKTVMADGHPMESDTFFRVHWNCGKILLQSSNGRFLGIAANGLLMANATIPGEPRPEVLSEGTEIRAF